MKIKTVDVIAKEWFDKANGNSYFSAVITVNFGMKTEKRIDLPFQYGYGNHYEHMAFNELKKQKIIRPVDDERESFWRYYRDHEIIYRASINRNCLKRELNQ